MDVDVVQSDDVAQSRNMGKHDGSVHAIVFLPDGKRFVSTSGDHSVRLWDIATGEMLVLAKAENLKGDQLSVSPDGQEIAMTGDLKEICTIGVTSREVKTIVKSDGNITGVRYSPDGRFLAYSDLGSIYLLDRRTNQTRTLATVDGINSIAFSPDGSHLASTSAIYTSGASKVNTRILFWNVETGGVRTIASWEETENPFSSVKISGDGKLLAAINYDYVGVWDITTAEQLKFNHARRSRVPAPILALNSPGVFTIPMSGIAFSGDSRRLATVDRDGYIGLWRLYGGKPNKQ
jgi:WD40 repeat protein